MAAAGFSLLAPAQPLLPGYRDALARGWSPNNLRDVSAAEIAAIDADPSAFLAVLNGEMPGSVTLPDGRIVPRLPGFTRWMWDGEFCGSINLRHLPGRHDLPPHVSGHVGYAVVPWKRGRGYATKALGLVLRLAAALGLDWVDATVDAGNSASYRVLLAHGGITVGPHTAIDGRDVERLLVRVPTRRT
jgi:predicted acetyltransferase